MVIQFEMLRYENVKKNKNENVSNFYCKLPEIAILNNWHFKLALVALPF